MGFRKKPSMYDEYFDCYVCPNDQVLACHTTNRSDTGNTRHRIVCQRMSISEAGARKRGSCEGSDPAYQGRTWKECEGYPAYDWG